MTTQKSNFLSRLIASNRPQPLGEAKEERGDGGRSCDIAALGSANAEGDSGFGASGAMHDEEAVLATSTSTCTYGNECRNLTFEVAVAMAPYCSAAAMDAANPREVEDEWHRPVGRSGAVAGGSEMVGPVAEGTEDPFGASTMQFTAAAAAAQLPSQGPLSQPGTDHDAAGGSGVASMQILYQQLTQAGSGSATSTAAAAGGGNSVAASLAVLQQQVAALQQMRMAVAASASNNNNNSGGGAVGSLSATAHVASGGAIASSLGGIPSNGFLLGPAGGPTFSQMPGMGTLHGMGATMPEPVDFVSVGLGPGPVGLPGGLMGGSKPAFSMGTQGHAKVHIPSLQRT